MIINEINEKLDKLLSLDSRQQLKRDLERAESQLAEYEHLKEEIADGNYWIKQQKQQLIEYEEALDLAETTLRNIEVFEENDIQAAQSFARVVLDKWRGK